MLCNFICSREYDFCNVTYHFEMGPQKSGNQDSHSREAVGATCYPGKYLRFVLLPPLAWCCVYSFYIIILIISDNKILNSFCSWSLVESAVQTCLEVLVLNNLLSQSTRANTVATTIYLRSSFESSLEICGRVSLKTGICLRTYSSL